MVYTYLSILEPFKLVQELATQHSIEVSLDSQTYLFHLAIPIRKTRPHMATAHLTFLQLISTPTYKYLLRLLWLSSFHILRKFL